MKTWRNEVAALSTIILLGWFSGSPPGLAAEAIPSTPPGSASPAPSDAPRPGQLGEEIAAFDGALQRYRERMAEYLVDTRRYVLAMEQGARADISDNYGRTIQSLIEDEESLKTLATERFEAFLKRHPNAEYSPHVMFRLGELYFEDAENAWLKANELHDQASRDASLQEMEKLPPPPLKDYTKPLRLYNEILGRYPNYERADGAWYMMGFCYSEVNSAQRDDDKGIAALKTLVEKYPRSEFANDANMRLGQHYFDNNDFPHAIEHYLRVVQAGEDARYYDKGLYKLAWSHYKLAGKDTFKEYYLGLDLFTKLLDFSHKMLVTKGEESSMEPEAIDYMAISFAEISDIDKNSPVKTAQEYFRKGGSRTYEPAVMKKLAEVLIRQARLDEAIEAYTYLQKAWPLDPDNPQFQARIVTLYMKRQPEPDIPASDRAKAALAERYHDESEWALANRNNPEALSVARGYIEQSLAKMATDLHLRAQQTNRPEDYSLAADRYQEYLRRFPFADDYYEMEWYLADALFKSRRLPEAEKAYVQLLKGQDHAFLDSALYRLMQVRRQMLIDKFGRVEARPDNAVLTKTVTTPFGAKINVYLVGDEHKDFIDVADKLVLRKLKDPQFEESRQQDLAALYYLPAQILFEHGHFEAARERLLKVVELFPRKDESAYSAGLVVRSYQEEGDLQKVRFYTGKFAKMSLGASEEAKQKKEQFASLEEGAAFKLAFQLIEEGKREQAVEAFMKFREEFPRSEHAPDALFNAANSLEMLGRMDRANTLFEDFINKYPTDERAKGFYFRIASNYASILELEKAIFYFERLVRNFPGAQDAPAALYNAAFLKVGTGDLRGAAEAFENYSVRYPNQPDAEMAFYTAGEQWEQVGASESLAFYRRYLKRFPMANQDHAMEAQYRIVKLTEREGKGRAVETEWNTLVSMYENFARTGAITATSRKYAAEGEFRAIWDSLESFKQIRYTGNEERDAKLLVETKQDDIKRLQDRCLLLIQKYQDFTWSSAAIYVQAEAYFAYADMLLDAPPPKGFTPEQVDFYKQQLDELRVPLEDKGKNRALAILEKARNERFWSEWQSRALALLNLRFPMEYPNEKLEERYTVHGQVYPEVGPVSVTFPEKAGTGAEEKQ
jgi:TolA-binding protein